MAALTGKPMNWKYVDKAREGDHICYISDLRKMKRHYPNWTLTQEPGRYLRRDRRRLDRRVCPPSVPEPVQGMSLQHAGEVTRSATPGLAGVTAAVLAGGLGTRLRPVVADRPEGAGRSSGTTFPGLPAGSDCSRGRSVRWCCARVIWVSKCEAHSATTTAACELLYSQESSPLGTGGALRQAPPLFESDPVLVLNGDSFCDLDLEDFWQFHRVVDAAGSLALTEMDDTRRYGRALVQPDGTISGFAEKADTQGPGWISAGIYLFSQQLLRSIPEDRPVSLEREILPSWAGRGLYGYRSKGAFPGHRYPRDLCGHRPVFRIAEAAMKGRRCVVLDRDGTIIVERHYLSDPDQVELIPGAVEGLRRLREMGLGLAVVTNQSGVGRGLFDTTRLDLIHRRMSELLEAEGVSLDGIYYCPHTPEDDCGCRKPRTGLLERASKELGLDFETAFVVGDKPVDIELGRRVGATTFLVRTGYGAEVIAQGPVDCDYVVDDLRQAAGVIARLLPSQGTAVSDALQLDRAKKHLLESAEIKRQASEQCADEIVSAARLHHQHFSGGRQAPAVRQRRQRRRLPAHGGRVCQPPYEGVRAARPAGDRLDHRQLFPDGVHQRLWVRGRLLPSGRGPRKAARRAHRHQYERQFNKRDPRGGRRAQDRHADDCPDRWWRSAARTWRTYASRCRATTPSISRRPIWRSSTSSVSWSSDHCSAGAVRHRSKSVEK